MLKNITPYVLGVLGTALIFVLYSLETNPNQRKKQQKS